LYQQQEALLLSVTTDTFDGMF